MRGADVYLVDNNGKILGNGVIEKILRKPNKTNVARIKSLSLHGDDMLSARGFIIKSNYPEPIIIKPFEHKNEEKIYVCHCEDVTLDEVLTTIGDRKFISVDEIKHTTRLGMGACRGKRCIKRLKSTLAPKGIQVVGDATPRGPLSNQLALGELYPKEVPEIYVTGINGGKARVEKVSALIAGGGIGGSALFRYMSEAGLQPTMLNYGRGSSWRNIAGGRIAFSLPEIAEIARLNHNIFKELDHVSKIDYRPINYVTFAHNDNMVRDLEASMAWSDAYMVQPSDFQREISTIL